MCVSSIVFLTQPLSKLRDVGYNTGTLANRSAVRSGKATHALMKDALGDTLGLHKAFDEGQLPRLGTHGVFQIEESTMGNLMVS